MFPQMNLALPMFVPPQKTISDRHGKFRLWYEVHFFIGYLSIPSPNVIENNTLYLGCSCSIPKAFLSLTNVPRKTGKKPIH